MCIAWLASLVFPVSLLPDLRFSICCFSIPIRFFSIPKCFFDIYFFVQCARPWTELPTLHCTGQPPYLVDVDFLWKSRVRRNHCKLLVALGSKLLLKPNFPLQFPICKTLESKKASKKAKKRSRRARKQEGKQEGKDARQQARKQQGTKKANERASEKQASKQGRKREELMGKRATSLNLCEFLVNQ